MMIHAMLRKSVKVDTLNTVALSYGFNNTLSLLRNALSSQILTTTVNSVVNTYQLVTGNKKGSTANATSLNNSFINHYANDNSDNNANLFNILVQRGLIVNYSPDCLAFRCLRLISSRIAVTMNWASLSSSCFNASMASSTSSGTLAVFWRDLLFSVPVAIVYSLILKWESLYLFLANEKYLKCKSLDSKVQVTLFFLGSKITKPRQCSNTNRASNHNVKRSNTMAMYKSTQTHPKFLWRFFSCQQFKYFLVEATNEQEARSMLPDSPCLFSARIRQGVTHG